MGGFHHGYEGIFALGQGNLGEAGSEGGQMLNSWGKAFGLVKPSQTQDPAAPPAPPTLGQTNLIGQGQILSHEQRMSAASTTLTGGAGLLDEPTTASQVLLGS